MARKQAITPAQAASVLLRTLNRDAIAQGYSTPQIEALWDNLDRRGAFDAVQSFLYEISKGDQ